MIRAEAEKLVGTKVSAWTAFRGAYSGELLRIIPTKPFRAVIRVESVMEIPEGNRANLIAAGEVLEVGGVNIRPLTEPTVGYQAAVILLLKKEKEFLDRWEADSNKTNRHTGDKWVIQQRREAIEKFRRAANV